MPSILSPPAWLLRQVGRLRNSLSQLIDRFRSDLASTIGRVVADAVKQAVEELTGNTSSPVPRPVERFDDNRRWDNDPWADDDFDEVEDDLPEPVQTKPTNRLSSALKVGARAAAWWFGRASRWPVVGSVAVALVVAGGTLLTGASEVVGALVGLVDGITTAASALMI
jgi:hypothetical protein